MMRILEDNLWCSLSASFDVKVNYNAIPLKTESRMVIAYFEVLCGSASSASLRQKDRPPKCLRPPMTFPVDQNFHSGPLNVRNSTRRESTSRIAADGVPYNQPHPSPGFTMSVSPRVFISC